MISKRPQIDEGRTVIRRLWQPNPCLHLKLLHQRPIRSSSSQVANPLLFLLPLSLSAFPLLYQFWLRTEVVDLVRPPWFSPAKWRTTIRCWRSWAVSGLRDIEPKIRTDFSLGGSFGVVYKALEKSTGELVAVKHVRTTI